MHVYVTCFYSCKHLLLIESCTRPVKRAHTHTLRIHAFGQMDNRTKQQNDGEKKQTILTYCYCLTWP